MAQNIAYLSEHLESIQLLTEWFRAQWPEHFSSQSDEEIARGFHDEANQSTLPIRLVALCDETLVGTIVLRTIADRTVPSYQPGLGGLLVRNAFRKRGIGTELVQAGMALARELGYSSLFATTATAGSILTNLGWDMLQEIDHDGQWLKLYCYELRTDKYHID